MAENYNTIPEDLSSLSCPCFFNLRPLTRLSADGSIIELTEDEIQELKVAYWLERFPNGL